MNAVSTPAIPIALTIAGSDSGGGAGIQADLKTFQRFRVFGTSVVTAVTAQNTLAVTAWEAIASGLVRAQIDAVVADLRPAAVKSGMLGSATNVETVAAALREHALAPYVLDPVMVSTSGAKLFGADTIDAIRATLVPLATLVTPNLDEAEILLGARVRDVFSMKSAAEALVHQFGAGAALVKGGHLDSDTMIDVLYAGGETKLFSHARIETRNTHGTGCTLSSSITAHLAKGVPLIDAVRLSLDHVHEAIRTAPSLGAGHGPVNHWA
jgi:hydroxymethylpyrimidine/phosphomethylpyrimidine kinase